jgi:hypothetical protein
MPESMTFARGGGDSPCGDVGRARADGCGQLQPGQKLLINGAGGGVGTLGVQIAHAIGVTDMTGVDRAGKFDLMRSVGFTHTIDYTQTDFTAGQERYDLILDTKTESFPFQIFASAQSWRHLCDRWRFNATPVPGAIIRANDSLVGPEDRACWSIYNRIKIWPM